MKIHDFRTDTPIDEGKFVGGNSPIDGGSKKAAAEIAKRLVLADLSFSVISHGENPPQAALKDKIYFSVDGQGQDKAVEIAERVKEIID